MSETSIKAFDRIQELQDDIEQLSKHVVHKTLKNVQERIDEIPTEGCTALEFSQECDRIIRMIKTRFTFNSEQ